MAQSGPNKTGQEDRPGNGLGAPAWRQVWQLPAAVASVGLMSLALLLMLRTQPQIDFPAVLTRARQMADLQEFDEAFDVLAEAERHASRMSERDRQAFLLMRGDLYYERQVAVGGKAEHNLAQVISDYRDAEEAGAKLSPQRIFQTGDALIRLERPDEVPAVINRLPPAESALRQRLIKTLIDRNLALSTARYAETVDLLMRLFAEADLKAADRIWAVARLTELRLRQGFVAEAVDKLLVAMQQLRADGIREFPELYLLLGRGFLELGRYDSALEHLQTASEGLPTSNALRGEAILLQAQIAQQRMEWDEAYQMFNHVVVTYPGTPSFLPALLGRSEIQAQLGHTLEAMDDYNSLVRSLAAAAQRVSEQPRLSARQVATSLIVWHDRRREEALAGEGDPDMGGLHEALQYARIAASLFGSLREMPEDLVLRLAQTNWTLGDAILSAAWRSAGIQLNGEGLPIEPDDLSRVDAATRRQAQRHFLDAGEYYRRLAEMAIQFDPDASAESLRWAARCFDRGGEYLAAAAALKEFIRLSAAHPRELWGLYMLGRTYQALGDFDGAIEHFRTLVSQHHQSIEAHRSYVPLAQCSLRKSGGPDPAEAERLLLHIVDGAAGLTPDAWEFADALIELGTLYSRADDYPMPRPATEYYPEAIRRLTEAIERYPDDPRRNDLHYRLAHAYRLSAAAIKDELTMERPEAERLHLSRLRSAHLDAAALNYAVAIDGYESIPAHKRSAEAQQSLKFATFWRADCAFDQAAYQEAIRLYSSVADRYSEDATAIVALIQIVNCYAELGDLPAARTAQNRAWRMLRDLPPAAFESSPLPLSRDAWERILRSNRLTENELSSADRAPGGAAHAAERQP